MNSALVRSPFKEIVSFKSGNDHGIDIDVALTAVADPGFLVGGVDQLGGVDP